MNILLDSELEPHISDFGIAKLLEEFVASTQNSAVQGTIGYIAPENAFSTSSSKECDVYAYSVVLLELITRKKVLDTSFGGDIDIVGWTRGVWNGTEEDIEMILDPMGFSFFKHNVFLVALRCTEKDASKRPSMRDIVKQLILLNDSSTGRTKFA